MPLAMAHALLVYQSYYGNNAFVIDNHWTLADLAAAVDVFKKVLTKCGSADGVKSLVAQVYSDHCVDMTDSPYVSTIVKHLAEIAAKGQSEVCNSGTKTPNYQSIFVCASCFVVIFTDV